MITTLRSLVPSTYESIRGPGAMTVQEPHLSHPKYRPDIAGLRGVAVLAVVAFHAFPSWIIGGFIGVDVFFVISGYLISTIIFESLDKGTFSFFEFYSRRIKRIFPALILVLGACFAFGWFVLLGDELNQLGKHIAAGSGFISNLVLWSEAGYFDSAAETKPLLHLWSLGIEEQFYIVWPLLLWFVWKRKFNVLTITIVVAVASFILNLKGIKQDMVATFYSLQSRFWELLSGSLLAWATLYKKDAFANIKSKIDFWLPQIIFSNKQDNDGKTLANGFSFVGLFLLVYGFLRINKELSFPGKWALVPVLGAVLIITAGAKAWVNRTLLSNKIVVWVGLISFPLYLWHWPLLSFARIVEGEVPIRNIRISSVFLSVFLAWLTARFIEKPIRLSNKKTVSKLAMLCGIVFVIGISGLVVSKLDFSQSHGYEKLAIKRKGFVHAFGSSLTWYRGREDWLFIGNSYDNTVAKLKLAIVPSDSETEATKKIFSKISEVGAKSNVKVVLLVGPNKSSIYSEYLPKELSPSAKKYSSFFLDKIKNVPNLTVYNPTDDFLNLKKSEGYIYWMTDSHWNNKGAFLAYSGFANLLGLPVPQVEFKQGAVYSGALLETSKLKDFPLHAEDNWDVIWKNKPTWIESDIADEQKTVFGSASVVINNNPLSNKYVWVVGDSFTVALRQYFNSSFKEVRYIGHWHDKLKDLPDNLAKADRKPDMIIVVRVERSF